VGRHSRQGVRSGQKVGREWTRKKRKCILFLFYELYNGACLTGQFSTLLLPRLNNGSFVYVCPLQTLFLYDARFVSVCSRA